MAPEQPVQVILTVKSYVFGDCGRSGEREEGGRHSGSQS